MDSFKIMTDGLVLSRHETHAQAALVMATARAEAWADVERLRAEVEDAESFANSFSIESL